MDSLTGRLGTRFLVVTVVPNILLLGYLGFLLAAGAPTRQPSLMRAIKALDGLSVREIIAILLLVLILSVATHPLQTPLIKLMEGYWHGLPFGSAAQRRLSTRFREDLRDSPSRRPEQGPSGSADEQAADAVRRRHWLPEEETELLPTVLGNTLTAGEHRAGERYGLELDNAWPRMRPLVSAASLDDLRDRRNQLDAAARLCLVTGLATVVGLGLLLWHGSWLFLPVVTYVFCWACYRAAIAAAQGYSNSLAAAVDLHHLQIFDALALDRPANLAEEYERNTETLDFLFRGELPREEMRELRYRTPKPGKPPAE
ncbi:MAG TPA: hypothetical protein VMH35_18260 [Streptosporangiaceae bacterium]|nr:hypothetical protein [Streptosporangiaceae bacterium]